MSNWIIISTAHLRASMGGMVGAGQHHTCCRAAFLLLRCVSLVQVVPCTLSQTLHFLTSFFFFFSIEWLTWPSDNGVYNLVIVNLTFVLQGISLETQQCC